MGRRPRGIWGIVGMVAGCLAVGAAAVRAETEYETAQQTLKAKGQSITSEPKLNTQALEKKLDRVLANQQTMLERLDAMTEELHIIKIRATR